MCGLVSKLMIDEGNQRGRKGVFWDDLADNCQMEWRREYASSIPWGCVFLSFFGCSNIPILQRSNSIFLCDGIVP